MLIGLLRTTLDTIDPTMLMDPIFHGELTVEWRAFQPRAHELFSAVVEYTAFPTVSTGAIPLNPFRLVRLRIASSQCKGGAHYPP